MVDLNTTGIILVLSLIVLYGLFTLIFEVLSGNNSLRNSEAIHRFLLVVGGMLLGLGLTLQHYEFYQFEIGASLVLGLLFFIVGLFVIVFGINYLRSSLWNPLEHISEYSAEFSTNFVATRLPLTGNIELQKFSQRFNDNVRKLGNDISMLEIEVSKLIETTNSTISKSNSLSKESNSLSDLALNYSDLANSQYSIVQDLGSEINEFVDWYDETKQRLSENFIELRGLSEMGNMIAINAAIEASNLEEPNPGFETLASKLRDLARSLEERQSAMKRLVDEIGFKYSEFKNKVTPKITSAMDISENTNNISERVDDVLSQIGEKEIEFQKTTSELKAVIDEFKSYIPNSY